MSTIKTAVSTTTEIISGFNDWVGFFQWLRPDNNQESKQQHEELWKLQTTLPLMQVMIDRAEWSIHKEGVPILLQELKDVSYDTEDLIEEFKYFKLKSEMDGPQSLLKRSLDFIKNDILSDNLDYLQNKLAKVVGLNQFLVVLDDVWDDSLKDNGQEWQKFCAPLTTGVQGSMILMTTRSSKVAKLVCTLSPFQLQGLEEDTFWEFFKACALDGKRSTMDIKLASIGRMIVPKLKGSPLAAKTLGRLLRMKIDTVHWSNILNSELWELKQEVGDILPALALSYLYLPRHLRRCLALCAMFPKDHKFKKTVLVDLWSAQCFVEQDKMCMHTAGDWCFEELESRCFFQEVVASSASAVSSRNKKYVMHDLIHDMIQLVSGNECFVIRNETDLSNVHIIVHKQGF